MASSSYFSQTSVMRFTDVGKLPKKQLPPIAGYENVPLVSLEEAVKPLVHIVPNVEQSVNILKQKCQDPKDDLTPDQSAAIMLYTYESVPHDDSLYLKLNNTLRSERRRDLIPWFLYLRLILTALNLLPSHCGLVYRGIKKNLLADYVKGKNIIWWAFSSCTCSLDVLENEQFLGKIGDRTLFQIECTTAKNIKNHSCLPNEDEVLLLPAREFQVSSCLDAADKLYIVHLKEIKPENALLEPVPMPDTKGKSKKILTIGTELLTAVMTGKFEPMQLQMHAASGFIPIRGSTIEIPSSSRWLQNGLTVAGGNGIGNRTNQFNCPYGVYVDDHQTVYIADRDNHRIVEWKSGAKSGLVVAGGNDKGNRPNQLSLPYDMIVDKDTESLIISDHGNRRVVRWPLQHGTSGETIISNIDCLGLTIDDNGSLYVTDVGKHEVRRYHRGESQGIVVAGGNGNGNRLNQLSAPSYVFVDRDYSVYVSDWGNHRVMKWIKGVKQGIVVAGGQGDGNSLTQLSYPEGVVVDQNDNVYVVDDGNARIMRWSKGAKQGSLIIGGKGKGEDANQLNWSIGLSFDQHGNLYVVDNGNHRVQKFNFLSH